MSIKIMSSTPEKDIEKFGPGRAFEIEKFPGWTRPEPIKMFEFAEARVVATREHNMFDDNDFYATYYDPADDTFKETMFGTTRAWSYPCSARVDAPPELMDKFKLFKLDQARKEKERRKALVREWLPYWFEHVSEHNHAKIYRLIGLGYTNKDWLFILEQLASATRSKFRLSLRDQVLAWFEDDSPKHSEPLSPRQGGAILKYRPRY